jgi:hypothetical protein
MTEVVNAQTRYVTGLINGYEVSIEVSQVTWKRFAEDRKKLGYTAAVLLEAIMDVHPMPKVPDDQWLNRGLGFVEVMKNLQAVDLTRRPTRERFQQVQK